jgi:hypothetical protein
MGFQNGWRGPDIVSDGLVLYLDAGSPNSYRPDFGTTWKDMSGFNNSGSLINGPTYSSANGGSIVFDGVDDYISTLTLSSIPFSDITIQLWIYPTNIGTGNGYITVFDTLNRQLSLWIGNGFYGIGGGLDYYNASSFNWQNNNWYFITMMKSGSIGSLIKNNYETSINLGSVGTTFTNQLQFGSNPSGGGTVMNGKYSNIRIYNRALSTFEVAQNYNALKSRFGL